MLYYVRMSVLYPYLILVCILIHLLAIVRPFHRNNMALVAYILNRGAMLILGSKMEVEGSEHLYPDEPTVYISNHQHTLDIFFVIGLIKQNTVTLGKKQLLYIPIFGLAYWLTGNILIERYNREKAMAALKKVANKMKKRDTSILVFPEGTRNWGKMLPFKSGAFNVAIAGEKPIVQIVVEDYNNALNLNKWKSGTLHVKVLPAIKTEGMNLKSDVKPLARQCQQTMTEEFVKINEKFQSV